MTETISTIDRRESLVGDDTEIEGAVVSSDSWSLIKSIYVKNIVAAIINQPFRSVL